MADETKVKVTHEEAGASLVVEGDDAGNQDARVETTPEKTVVEVEEN